MRGRGPEKSDEGGARPQTEPGLLPILANILCK